ncbi:hypothetical protein F5X96DRAFT_634231 [Biscogniauxia mediterranea]|nr:hypothetical protein F5X96DRAFT_634231 [Biscogniauxia mediterranea]
MSAQAGDVPIYSASSPTPENSDDEENWLRGHREALGIGDKPATTTRKDDMTVDILCLPSELLLEIMHLLSHPDDLENFVSSHKRFRDSFNTHSASVIRYLTECLAPGCTKDALAAFGCPLVKMNDPEGSLGPRIENYINGRIQWPKTLRDYRCFWELVFKVDMCIFDWVSLLNLGNQVPFLYQEWPGGLRRDEFMGLRGLPHLGISDQELLKFRRAFFRYESYCRFCYQEPNQPTFSPMYRRKLYSAGLMPWDLEEMACVISYVTLIYYSFMYELRQDFFGQYATFQAQDVATDLPEDSWADWISTSPQHHPRLAYLGIDCNILYGLVSLGVDWLVDFKLMSTAEQRDLFLSTCNQFSLDGFPNSFFLETWTRDTEWERSSFDELEADHFHGDTAMSGNEVWFIYNEFVTQEYWDKDSPNVADKADKADKTTWMIPFSILRAHAWAFWDSPTLMGTLPYHFEPSGRQDIVLTVTRLNRIWSPAQSSGLVPGRRLLQKEWELLLAEYGLRSRPRAEIQKVTTFKTNMDRRWEIRILCGPRT